MRHTFIKISFTAAIILLSMNLLAQDVSSRKDIIDATNVKKLNHLEEKYKIQSKLDKEEAISMAKEKGWIIRKKLKDGRLIELQGLTKNNKPLYYITNNADAAETVSTDELWAGGSLGLSLSGNGMTLGEWDGGGVLTTHQEFGSRVTQQDSPSSTSEHSTHVAGTMVAAGVDLNAKGMAYEASLNAYDWNSDESEVASEASNGLLVSNHSYGIIAGWYWDGSQWVWSGDESIDSTEDYNFGFYSSSSQTWDDILYNAPYLLKVKSAGNDRVDGPSSNDTNHEVDGGADGYDCISHAAIAKNLLTVGAVDDITGGYNQVSDAVMTSFSSWGPCDDGRIKPDICGNGMDLYSTSDAGNDQYTTMPGTSMSSPNVAGSLILLQEYFNDLYSSYMKAATLKALVINTADEAGDYEGPDYKFGWGLLNTATAAQAITDKDINSYFIEESLNDASQYTLNIEASGSEPLVVTMVWADPAGTPVTAQLDPADIMLVNDLDITITDGTTTYYPYKLDVNNPANAATTGNNDVDNVEKIYIETPTAGTYTITVNHEGVITDGPQDFSLIVSGISNNYPSVKLDSVYNISQNTADLDGEVTTNGGSTVTERGFVYNTAGNPDINDNKITSGSGVGTYQASMSGLSSATTYYVRAYAVNATGTNYSSQVEFTTDCGSVSSYPYTMDFESGNFPVCWSQEQGAATTGWQVGNNGSSDYFTIADHTYYVYVNDDACNCDMSDVWLISPSFDFTNITSAQMSFASFADNSYGGLFTIKYSTNDGSSWTDLTTITANSSWTAEIIDLSSLDGNSNVKMAFHYNDESAWATGWAIDDIVIDGTTTSNISADFTADQTSGTAPFTVNFSDLSSGTITSYKWDFDNDGTVDATTENPSYEYTTAGTYSVKLVVSDGTSEDSLIKTDYITVNTAPSGDDVSPFSWLHPNPQGNSINNSYFLSQSLGFVCGDDGTLMKTTDAGSSWTVMDADTLQALYGVYFFNKDTGFVTGYGYIKKTTDGGNTWMNAKETTYSPLNDITFIDDTTGIIVGNYGDILRSVDGGDIWTEVTVSSSNSFYDVLFLNSSDGFAVGSSGAILSTTDSGKTWAETLKGTESLRKIFFIDGSNGFIVGENGSIYKTSDGGVNWTLMNTGVSQYADLYTAYFEDGNTGIVAGNDYIYKTTDGGSNWTQKYYDYNLDHRVIINIATSTYLIMGRPGYVMKTTDSGENWKFPFSNMYDDIESLSFYDASTGYAVADGDSALKTIDGGVTWNSMPLDEYLHDVIVIGANTVLAAGNDGQVYKTTDGGDNWTGYGITTYDDLFAIQQTTNNTVYAVGMDTLIMKSTDLGDSWTKVDPPATTEFNLHGLHFFDDSRGLIIGGAYNEAHIFETQDGGNQWTEITSPIQEDLNAIQFVNDSVGYICGADATILKSTDTGKTWIQQSVTIPSGFSSDDFEDIAMFDESNGIVVGSTGLVFKTTNGGTSWEYVENITRNWLRNIELVDGSAIISGNDGTILKYDVGYEAQLAANFSADNTDGYAPLTVNFTDQSTGNVTSWSWDFNNDGTEDATTQNPSYDYTQAGTYTVSLTVGDGSATDTKTISGYITVKEPIVANFTSDVTSGTSPLEVNFTDQSTGNVTSWNWDFDNDGNPDATSQNPSYTYNSSGTYSVSLTVSDGTTSDTKIITDMITVSDTLYAPYSLTASLDESNGGVELSWNHDDQQTSFYEDFTDGIADNWVDVSGNWSVSNNVYEVSSNSYKYNTSYYNLDYTDFELEVKLRKNSGTDYNSVSVFFLGDPSQTNSDKRWTNSYRMALGIAGYSDRWSLGYIKNDSYTALQNWTSSTDINTGFGSYNIVKIKCNSGTIDVYINDVLQGSYSDQTFTSGKVGISMYDSELSGNADFDYVKITPINTKTTKSFQNFKIYRDGSFIANVNGTSYTDSLADYGSYDYKVTASYSEGESDASAVASINWEAPSVTADFTADVTSGEAPLTVNFSDQSTGNITSWSWDFDGDGTEDATTQNPSYQFTSAGNYSVSLTVSDGTNSDTETKTDYIVVSETVEADFTADVTSGEAPLTVNFSDQSTGNITSWSWDFDGDGTEDATTQYPAYTYEEAGSYTVSLTVSDGNGSDTETKSGYITVTESFTCDWNFESSDYIMNFEVSDDFTNWKYFDLNGDGQYWEAVSGSGVEGTNCVRYQYSEVNPANDWLLSRCFNLKRGKYYKVEFYYAVAAQSMPEKLLFAMGSDQNPSSMNTEIVDLGEITNEDFIKSENVISVSSDATYYFGWKAYSNANNWNIYVDAFKISLTDAPTSLDDQVAQQSVRVYPNPSSGRFEVHIDEYASVERLEVLTLEGSRVFVLDGESTLNNKIQLNLDDEPAGIYILKVYKDNKVITKKLIRQ